MTYRRSVRWWDYNGDYLSLALAPEGTDESLVMADDTYWSADPVFHTSAPFHDYVTHAGPREEPGITLDIDLGSVAFGAPVTFTLYYGIVNNPTRAAEAVAAVGADVYALAETSRSNWTTTSVFAYRHGVAVIDA